MSRPDLLTPHSGLDAENIRRRVAEVLAEPLYWFPVRHHSPTVARQLLATLEARRPGWIFLEAPSEAADLLRHVVDRRTKPPVAIYSSFRDDHELLAQVGLPRIDSQVPIRLSSFYPLLEYSPEYVALRWAHDNKAQVVCIDLPHFAGIGLGVRPPGTPAAGDPAPTPVRPRQTHRADDELVAMSGFYQALAHAAGYRDWNEAWDTLFETAGASLSPDDFRSELATFCCAVRATVPPEILAADDTLPRERMMWQTISRTLSGNSVDPRSAIVVCGGFHLFLDRNDPTPPPEIPRGTVYTSVVPYSFFRVSELAGYAAGNRAPQYYQLQWDLAAAGRQDDLLAEHVVAVLKRARREGEPASSADAISVSQHARMLASLRGRPAPVLDDIHDAIMTCCCKGDPAQVGHYLRKAIDAVDIGTKVGKVTPDLGRLPIVDDFHRVCIGAGLEEMLANERRTQLTLDKRNADAAKQSVLFHRLAYLQIPFAVLVEAPQNEFASGTLFRERWQVQWSPKVEPALVDQSLYGDTIDAAVVARFREEFAGDDLHAGRTCQRLVQTLELDLPELVSNVEQACHRAIDNDPRFTSLAQALHWLRLLHQRAGLRGLDRQLLGEMLARCYDRACFAIPEVASVPEDQESEVLSGLLTVADCVLRDSTGTYDRELFALHVKSAAAVSPVPFLRGAFLGLLTELRVLEPEELAHEVAAFASAAPDVMAHAGDFVDGALAVSRTSLLVGADTLVRALDPVLRSAPWETFLLMLPRLRAAFERLHGAQVQSVAGQVAEFYGLKEAESLTDLRTSTGAAAWLARLDREVAEILEAWGV